MRKIVLVVFLLVASVLSVLSSTLASAANTAASAARSAPASSTVTLTPEQARAALAVLNDPSRRSQIEDTLRAVAAAGALSTPVQAASGSAAPAATASAASGASGAASVLAKSLTSNGLASQISHEAGSWIMELSSDLRRSVTALLDYGSVMRWWQQRAATTSGRELIGQVIWSISISLLPALLLEYLSSRWLRRLRARIAARGIVDVDAAQPELAKQEQAAVHAEAVAEHSGNEAAIEVAERKTDTARGVRHAARHWTLFNGCRAPSFTACSRCCRWS